MNDTFFQRTQIHEILFSVSSVILFAKSLSADRQASNPLICDKKKDCFLRNNPSNHLILAILVYFLPAGAFAGAAAAAGAADLAGAVPVAGAASSWRKARVVTTETIGILGELRIS